MKLINFLLNKKCQMADISEEVQDKRKGRRKVEEEIRTTK